MSTNAGKGQALLVVNAAELKRQGYRCDIEHCKEPGCVLFESGSMGFATTEEKYRGIHEKYKGMRFTLRYRTFSPKGGALLACEAHATGLLMVLIGSIEGDPHSVENYLKNKGESDASTTGV